MSNLDENQKAYVITADFEDTDTDRGDSLIFNIPNDYTSRNQFYGLMQIKATSEEVDLSIRSSSPDVYLLGCREHKVPEL
jgi:hypothetical protein